MLIVKTTRAAASQPISTQTLTDGANIAWNGALGVNATVTLGGNRILDNATGLVAGTRYSLRVIQDGVGGRLLTWGANYKFPGGIAPTLTATAGKTDLFEFLSDGTNLTCTGGSFSL